MTNVKILLIIIASLLIGGGFVYALQESPEARIEKENKQAIRECLSSIDYESTSNQILRATAICSELKMKEITNSNKLNNAKATTGSVIPVASRFKELEGKSPKDIVISDWLNSQEFEMIAGLQNRICEKQPNSPLCKEEWLLERLYIITEQRLPGKNWFPILLGMTNAESSLGTNFARDNVGGTCIGRNNLGGAKYKINDDNTRVYSSTKFGYDYKTKKKDDFGCYLFPFDSIEDYWISKVNGMRFGYKGCIDSPTPVKCLSYAYVGKPDVSEQSWINNVSIFLK